MKPMEIFYILIVLLAGIGVPIQTASNAALGKSLGGPIHSTLAVFLVGLFLIIFIFVLQKNSFPSGPAIAQAPWWGWLGGPLGVAYIFVLIHVAPKVGMASAVGFVILGQILGAVLLDHFGWLNFPVHKINWQRAVGAILMIIGVFLIRKF